MKRMNFDWIGGAGRIGSILSSDVHSGQPENLCSSDRSEKTTVMPGFSELNLFKPLQRALAEEGYEIPTPIQEQTIPAALEGRDILGCAQTGTGKTAAFALPILDELAGRNAKPVSRRPLCLLLAPTRELAIQIGESFDAYGKYTDFSHTLIYGGVGQGKQVKAIRDGVHALVATPGRLLDLMGQEEVFLNRLQFFVLDEADRMMDMGFLPDLKRIMKALPVRRQSMFFSATMPRKIVQLADKLLHDPVKVDVAPTTTNVELIDQRVIFADHRQKKPMLVKLLTAGDVGQAIVFTKTKRGAEAVTDYLKRKKIDAVAIHGNKSQNQRQRAMGAFRSEKSQVLVATDLAARGIDVEGISHVFNFELPMEPESYVHRIGRTGRAGARGIAISLVAPIERTQLQRIEKLIGFEILPDGREPEPVPETVSTEATNAESDSRSRNRRRRRNRGRRSSGSPEAAAPAVQEEKPERRARPTAAERKRARNARKRRSKKDNE